ncbi:MAG: hypothetical protein ACOY46_20055 [Bacillota bacterium]
MKRVAMIFFITIFIVTGCSALQDEVKTTKEFSEQDIRNAVTELVNGINSGNPEIVRKYVDEAGPVTEKLIEKLKNNIRLSNIRDVQIQGTNAQATVTLEVVPLKINRDITLNFDITDVLVLDNPLGLLTILLP